MIWYAMPDNGSLNWNRAYNWINCFIIDKESLLYFSPKWFLKWQKLSFTFNHIQRCLLGEYPCSNKLKHRQKTTLAAFKIGCPFVRAYSAPSHYLNKFWLISIGPMWTNFSWDLHQNTKLFIKESAFENVWKTEAILSCPRCVNSSWCKLVQAYVNFVKSI